MTVPGTKRLRIRRLAAADVAQVDATLPLHRLDQGDGFYFVAWDGGEAVAHAYLALTEPPELQDVYVLPEHRRRGIATELTQAAEEAAVHHGFDRLTLTVGTANLAAQRLYERLGYRDGGVAPRRVQGTILIRGEPTDVDDTLLHREKPLPHEHAEVVDSGAAGSS